MKRQDLKEYFHKKLTKELWVKMQEKIIHENMKKSNSAVALLISGEVDFRTRIPLVYHGETQNHD